MTIEKKKPPDNKERRKKTSHRMTYHKPMTTLKWLNPVWIHDMIDWNRQIIHYNTQDYKAYH